MGKLRRNFERFCYKNRDKGIPNLMLYITIGSAIVYLLSMVNGFNGGTGGEALYNILCFDKAAILRGQVWRLFTYVFTYNLRSELAILVLLGLYFFYNLSRQVEASMGTLKFNIFYFSGILLMDVYAMIFCPTDPVLIGGYQFSAADAFGYSNMALFLHMSIILMFSATNPDARFLILFVIPVKSWILGLIDLLLIAISVFNMTVDGLFPHCLFPLVGLLNFLLFAGKDVLNLAPFLKRIRFRRKPKPKTGTVPFPGSRSAAPKKADYTHRCVVCGRTDASNPELEFRYCSRCKGYFCYCQDHINNHTHIEE